MSNSSALRQQLTRSFGSLTPSQGTRRCQAEGYRNGRLSPNPMGSVEPKGCCCCYIVHDDFCGLRVLRPPPTLRYGLSTAATNTKVSVVFFDFVFHRNAAMSPCMAKTDLKEFVTAQRSAVSKVISYNPSKETPTIERQPFKWPVRTLGSQVGTSLTRLASAEGSGGHRACSSAFRLLDKKK